MMDSSGGGCRWWRCGEEGGGGGNGGGIGGWQIGLEERWGLVWRWGDLMGGC